MLESIRQLLILQERDVKLHKLMQEIESVPLEEKRIEEHLAKQTQKHLELKTLAAKIEADRRDLDNQVLSQKTLIGKYRSQQLETRKNEEFQALGHEIARTEEGIVALEDRELELMEKVEAAQKGVAAEALHVKEYTKTAETQRASLKARLETAISRRTELEKEIADLAATIDPSLLDIYRRILHRKQDSAIVPLVGDKTCGGCHVKVTHQIAISVRAGTTVTHCEQCGRILYQPEL